MPMIIRGPGVGRRRGPFRAHREHRRRRDHLRGDGHGTAGRSSTACRCFPWPGNPEEKTGRRPAAREPALQAGVEDGRYVYLEHDYDDDLEADEYELYDLRTDPRQLENLHLTHSPAVRPAVLAKRPGLADRRDDLAAELADLRTCSGAGCN